MFRQVILSVLVLLTTPREHPKAALEAHCIRATRPPVVDGKLDESVWKEAKSITDFPSYWSGKESTDVTSARLLWDDKGLYFGGELKDVDVRSFGKKRNDTLWNGDVFEMFFKPSSKNSQYYEFQVNPRSLVFELSLPGHSAPDRPSMGMKAVAVVHGTLDKPGDTDQGWTVEGFIPWSAFSKSEVPPKKGDVWSFALCRYDYGPGENPPRLTSSAPLRKPSFHKTEDYGKLIFEAPKSP